MEPAMPNDKSLVLSAKEAAETFSDPTLTAKYPPILTVDQAAEMLQVRKQTIYNWSSRGCLKGCSRRIGKHLRILRDKLILHAFNKGI
jgi:excisionase family DNA binding protein